MIKRLRWWLWEDAPDWLHDWRDGVLYYAALRVLCFFTGHDIWSDHCGLPEHDYCVLCMQKFPGQGQNRRLGL